jgi:hypothetical protein
MNAYPPQNNQPQQQYPQQNFPSQSGVPPYPQYPYQPQPGQNGPGMPPPQPQRNNLQNRIGSIIGFLAAITAVGYLVLHFSNFNFNANTPSAQVNTPTAQVNPTSVKVGDTITVNNVSCTLVTLNPYGDISDAIMVKVIIVNNSGNNISYNNNDFQIKDEGIEVFEIQYQHNAELIWQPNWPNDTDLSHVWKLGL